MTDRYDLRRGVIHRAYAEDIYPTMEPGSVRLVISDGPYAMKLATWDMMALDELPAWYRPHIEAWGRICMPSASVYLWGTAEGWARLDPVMRELGWEFRTLITWHKTNGLAQKASEETARCFPDITEVCGFYQRDEWRMTSPGTQVAYAAGADEQNWIRLWLREEWESSGLRLRDADVAQGTNGMAGHYFGSSQWSLPTWEAYQQLAAYAAEQGASRDRPYLVHESVWETADPPRATWDHLQASYELLRQSYDHLRAEYESKRAPFNHRKGIFNVWTHATVQHPERLTRLDGSAVHKTQKPLALVKRANLASTNPGELVLTPFGGTCREAVVCERLPEHEARRYICIEPDEDGRDYIAAVLPSLRLEFPESNNGQTGLFQ